MGVAAVIIHVYKMPVFEICDISGLQGEITVQLH